MSTDTNWTHYKRAGICEMRPATPGESIYGISVSDADLSNGSPREGDMVARNPKNHQDQWLVAKAYFEANFIPAPQDQSTDTKRLRESLEINEAVIESLQLWGEEILSQLDAAKAQAEQDKQALIAMRDEMVEMLARYKFDMRLVSADVEFNARCLAEAEARAEKAESERDALREVAGIAIKLEANYTGEDRSYDLTLRQESLMDDLKVALTKLKETE